MHLSVRTLVVLCLALIADVPLTSLCLRKISCEGGQERDDLESGRRSAFKVPQLQQRLVSNISFQREGLARRPGESSPMSAIASILKRNHITLSLGELFSLMV